MKQIDTRTTRLSILGTIFLVGETTMLLFGAFVMLLSLVGWHTLVFAQYIPNLYVFMVMLAGLWAVLAILVYKVLLPVAFRFQNQQQWTHSSPFREELEGIREEIGELKKLVEDKLK